MRRLSVVLDTNVVVSAHLNQDGNEAMILRLVFADSLRICLSEAILAEYELVLGREKFDLDPGAVRESLNLIRSLGTIHTPQHSLAVAADPSDNKFLECAEAAHAHFLVTGNKRHYPKRWQDTLVVNARELLGVLVPGLKR
jgi:putative PIN family toxin of toxin-antitoxin system